MVGGGPVASASGSPTQVALVGGFDACGGPGPNNLERVVRRFFNRLAGLLGLPATMPGAAAISIDDLTASLARPQTGSLLAIYAGHARERPGTDAPPTVGAQKSFTSLCLAPQEVPAQDVLAKIGMGPAVLVLGACQSAYIDVSGQSAVAVISASPRAIGADPPAFLDLVAEALGKEDLDVNCDGLVTDLELFTYVTNAVRRRDPQGLQRPIPKLRRQADIQLPILRRPLRPGCSDPADLKPILDRAGNLGADIRSQLAYARGEETLDFAAPRGDHLLLTFRGAGTPDLQAQVRAAVIALAPDGTDVVPEAIAPDEGRRLAKLNIAGEVYELRVTFVLPLPGLRAKPLAGDGIIVELLRPRELRLLAIRDLPDLPALKQSLTGLLPRRRFERFADNTDGTKTIAVRVIGRVPATLDVPGYQLEGARQAVPCAEEEGQCFVVRGRPVSGHQGP